MGNGRGGVDHKRFSGFADLYDANRPAPPKALGPLLACYANAVRPDVVDLGSGTGLSSRWAATWAVSVLGVEPNDDMRTVAESHPSPRVAYRRGVAHETRLDDDIADVVVAVQAMHWMEPVATLAEVARILRPGGVFAVIDADWPPVSGLTGAEEAWATMHKRIRVFEARAARGEKGDEMRRSIEPDDPALDDEDLSDPHRNRAMPEGLQSWSKSEHLERLATVGHFAFVREIVLSESVEGDAERFIALMKSQGSYQGLRRLGLSDAELGTLDFEQQVVDAFSRAASFAGLSFSWRIRLGVVS